MSKHCEKRSSQFPGDQSDAFKLLLLSNQKSKTQNLSQHEATTTITAADRQLIYYLFTILDHFIDLTTHGHNVHMLTMFFSGI